MQFTPEMVQQSYLIISILLPLVGAVCIFASKKWQKLSTWLTPAFALSTLFSLWKLYVSSTATGITVTEIKINVGMPFLLHFRADYLGIYLSLISSVLWLAASLYSVEYIHERKTIFNFFLMLSLFGMFGISLTGNLFSLLLFFELFSVASAILIIHDQTKDAIIAGFQYLFISVLGSVAVIVASVLIFKAIGNLDFGAPGLLASSKTPYFGLIFWLLMIGFGIKAGVFPVHVWLPIAHPIAPSSASALLSGVMIKAGVYGIIRTIYGIFCAPFDKSASLMFPLLIIALITMIFGSVLAIAQKEIKKLLAYSSVAQIGYMVLGASLMSKSGLTGGIFHIFVHAFMKGALFLSAGTIIHKTGFKYIHQLKGLAKYMPVTMLAITFSALSMIGVPPFAGFLSKWLLAVGALEARDAGFISSAWAYIVIGALLLSGLLNVIYYSPIIINGWFKNPEFEIKGAAHGHDDEHADKVKGGWLEPSWVMLLPVIVLSLGTLIFGIYPSIPMSLAEIARGLYL